MRHSAGLLGHAMTYIRKAQDQRGLFRTNLDQPNNQSNPDLDQSRYTVEPSIGQGGSGLPDGEDA